MKKVINKSTIFSFILGIILCSGIVYAASYLATDVSYTPTNETWEVDNVNDALDSLYELNSKDEGTKIINLGTGTTFDVSNYEGYENFTVDNFMVQVSSCTLTHDTATKSDSRLNSTIYPTVSYDASTGIATVTGLSTSVRNSAKTEVARVSMSAKLYLIY